MCNSALLKKGLRVLVVDNDLDSRDLLEMLFDEYEVETFTAASVDESLEIIQQVQPDLLISELCLPCEDGYALMRKVKAFEVKYQVQIPAIALTVFASEDDRLNTQAAGFCKHLSKPIDIDELITTIACVTQHDQECQPALVV
jgi:two-component system OmpR family response regulator